MAEPSVYNLVEQCQIFPANSRTRRNSSSSLPLTLLDLPLAGPVYVRRQFFYQFPHPTHHFYNSTLPTLKHSLSLTLQHFYPLAGNLVCPPPPHKPFIRCNHDHDSVPFTIIESSSADFKHLSSNHPKSLKELNHLVPKLTPTNDDGNDTFIFPLVSLQATVFPNCGLCISITYCHAMDDSCCSQFMNSWSSFCRTGKFLEKSPPCFDRKALKDTKGLEGVFLRDYFEERSTWKEKLIGQTSDSAVGGDDNDHVKATIVFGRDEIEGVKRWVLKNGEFNNLSKFVVACAFVWASLVKARYRIDDDDDDEQQEQEEYFRFAADCRDRLEYHVPEGYFGNCLTLCHAALKRKELLGEDGFVNAVKVIEKAVSDMKKEPFKDAEDWRASFRKMYVFGSVLLVTGSPRFCVYETDFGFGRPQKVEMVHSIKGVSLAESGGDEEGGLEFGLVFRKGEFDCFVSLIQQGLEAFKS